MGNLKSLNRTMVLICLVTMMGCAQTLSPRVATTGRDMDEVVRAKGIPRQVSEEYIAAGPYQLYNVTLQYPDGIYMFQTDAQKNHTVLQMSNTYSLEGIQQQPIPLWFKTKYPNLDWAGVQIR